MGRKSNKKRTKNDQNIMKSAPNSVKNRPGDFREALWRPLGCPGGPRLNFGSEKLVRWTPPGLPDGVHFSTCFQCKIHQTFSDFDKKVDECRRISQCCKIRKIRRQRKQPIKLRVSRNSPTGKIAFLHLFLWHKSSREARCCEKTHCG